MARFFISRRKVLEQYDKVRKACDIVSYSSKTNPIVTGILEENVDCKFSIHMKAELKNIRDKTRVLFLAQAWHNKDIEELVNYGVKWFVVDNEKDLDVLLTFLKNYEGKVNLLLRIKLKENTLRTEKYFVFGMSSETVNRDIGRLRCHEKIDKLGVHFHRKTQNLAEWNLIYEFENMVEKDNLDKLDLVCIGGGLPSEYANTNVKVLEGIFSRIKEFKNFLGNNWICF